MKYTIQKLLLHRNEYCKEEEMYFRRKGNVVCTDSVIKLDRHATCGFDTYFNSFSYGKWKKNTFISNLSLDLEIAGRFVVVLGYCQFLNGRVIRHEIASAYYELDTRAEMSISIPETPDNSLLYFELSAQEETVLYGGGFSTEYDGTVNDVHIALNMCTFKKEEYIYHNVTNLLNHLIKNENSPLHDSLSMYITDNAMSLDVDRISNEKIHVVQQNAFGSTGGFTRGLIEILADKGKYGYTHTIFLDDDIVLDPEVLVRNYRFLQFIKKEHQSEWIGGAMLGLDAQSIQSENGGKFNGEQYVSLKSNQNMNMLGAIVFNEVEESADVNAWWYCCIPLSEIDNGKLPYPVYFHCDDWEYATRNCKRLILLNGICVWHMEFHYKKDNLYFDKRNTEIVYALNIPTEATARKAKKRMQRNVLCNAFQFRYEDANDCMEALEDFLKGPRILDCNYNREKFQNLISDGRKEDDIANIDYPFSYDEYMKSFQPIFESRKKKIIRKLTLNGWLITGKWDITVPHTNSSIARYFRAKRAFNFNEKTKKGYVVEKKYRQMFLVVLRLIRLRCLISLKYNHAKNAYRESQPQMTNLAFWQNYFGLNNN